MFHFVNCTSSPEPVEESSADCFAAMSRCAPSSWRNTLGVSSSNASETESCPGSPSGMTFGLSTATPGEDEWTSSRGDFHARTSAPQAREPESTVPDLASGLNLLGSLARFDPDTSSWRTPQCSLIEDLDVFSETWPRWGSMRNGACWARMTLAPPTSENESGFWPTPNVPNGGRSCAHVTDWRGKTAYHNGKKVQVGLEHAVRVWPTPTVNGNYNRKGLSPQSGDGLATAVAKFPTPRAADGDHLGTRPTPTTLRRKEAGQANLSEFVLETMRTFPTPTARDYRSPGAAERAAERAQPLSEVIGKEHGQQGQLNPEWVEWLMGWPRGWTALGPLNPQTFRGWLQGSRTESAA